MNSNQLLAPGKTITLQVPQEHEGWRLDRFLVDQFSTYSRNFFQSLIEQQLIIINTKIAKKTGHALKAGDTITFTLPCTKERPLLDKKELDAFNIEIVFAHKDFLILNKPAGLLVHKPHKNSPTLDLVDWLLHHYTTIGHVGYSERPGIVHRLDKDTSGLLIVALTPQAHAAFSTLFKKRTIKKTYLAITEGFPEKSGVITFPLARHATVRTKVAHVTGGRYAETHFNVLEYFHDSTLVNVELITGRTHQIRVHFSTLGFPLIGDVTYGTASPLIKRQALHAHTLSFEYDGKTYNFTQEPPADFKHLVDLKKKLR
ncbi:RluA family pseudouridine synthase [bacterium]|nr:RluA family pseudouridine synthase [bacterium]